MRPRILLADECQLSRYALREFVSQQGGHTIAGEADNEQTVINLVKENNYDVLIIEGTILSKYHEVIPVIKEHAVDLKIIVLTKLPHNQCPSNLISRDVSAYISKPKALSHILEAIEASLQDKTYLCPDITEMVTQDYIDKIKRPGKSVQRCPDIFRLILTAETMVFLEMEI